MFFHAPSHCSENEVYARRHKGQVMVYPGEPSLAEFLGFMDVASLDPVVVYSDETKYLLSKQKRTTLVLFSDNLLEPFDDYANESDDLLYMHCAFGLKEQR